jgi:hypothetical protein
MHRESVEELGCRAGGEVDVADGVGEADELIEGTVSMPAMTVELPASLVPYTISAEAIGDCAGGTTELSFPGTYDGGTPFDVALPDIADLSHFIVRH